MTMGCGRCGVRFIATVVIDTPCLSLTLGKKRRILRKENLLIGSYECIVLVIKIRQLLLMMPIWYNDEKEEQP